MKLVTCLHHTITIVTIDDEDETLGVLEIMPPQRTDLDDSRENEKKQSFNPGAYLNTKSAHKTSNEPYPDRRRPTQ